MIPPLTVGRASHLKYHSIHDLFGGALTAKTDKLGIPYMGGKRKYADLLIAKMLEQKPNCKYFYDLFGGGGAMSFAALQKGMTVFYNEKQTDLFDLIKCIFECMKEPKSHYGLFPEHFYKFVTREDFIHLKNESGVYAQFVRICFSFGSNQKTYMFNPELEKLKHLAHDAVVFFDRDALDKLNKELGVEISISYLPKINQRRLEFIRQVKAQGKRLDPERLQRLQQLQRLQRLQQLEQLQQLEPSITFGNLDYRDVIIATPIEETIVYLDPPYRNTTKYIEAFDYSAIDGYFANLPYLAFMSEYNAPFKSIYEIETRSTLGASSNTCKKVEKLFCNHPEMK